MHKGEWAIHEVLPSLLCAIGEADVRIATFSVSEDSLRPLFFLTDETKIRSLTLLPPSEIAILIRIDADQRDLFCEICKNHTSSDIYTAYHRGRLQTKYELRKTVIKLAKAGSPAAEPLADKYMKEQNIQE